LPAAGRAHRLDAVLHMIVVAFWRGISHVSLETEAPLFEHELEHLWI
jgi:hypothetical protein